MSERAGKRYHILLINLHSLWNAGDDALAQEALRQLREQFEGACFTLAMNDPASYRGKDKAIGSFVTWVKEIGQDGFSHWRWQGFPVLIWECMWALLGSWLVGRPWMVGVSAAHKALLHAYLDADMVVSCAGNFLYSSGRLGLSLGLALFSILFAWLAGKPLYALPQTVGPIIRDRERLLAKWVLSRMRIVLLRDPISYKEWISWDVRGVKSALLPDLAFAFGHDHASRSGLDLLRQYGVCDDPDEPCMGITVIQWGAQNRAFSRQATYEKSIMAATRAFLQSCGTRVVFFPQVCGPTRIEDDRVAAERVVSQLGDLGEQVVLIDDWVPPDVLRSAYGWTKLLLGTRLHSNIFALSQCVPVVAVGYQYKTRGVLSMMGLEPWVIDIDEIDETKLASLVLSAWRHRCRIRSHLKSIVPELQAHALTAGRIVAHDFATLEG